MYAAYWHLIKSSYLVDKPAYSEPFPKLKIVRVAAETASGVKYLRVHGC